jgi:His-Xaa-Ser system protein HxsD
MEVIYIDQSSVNIRIDSTLYSSGVVHKCFYWYAANYSIAIITEEKTFVVKLTALKNESDIESLVGKIQTDLIDFKTREIIAHETKNIREMIIAKAFANSDEFEEKPTGNINDPVGFHPLSS